jgi:hypothetical protein
MARQLPDMPLNEEKENDPRRGRKKAGHGELGRVVDQIVEDTCGQTVGIVLARHGKRHDLRDDDLGQWVVFVAFELQYIAHFMKSCAYCLKLRGVYVVLRERHLTGSLTSDGRGPPFRRGERHRGGPIGNHW